MAKFVSTTNLSVSITMTISEDEARALLEISKFENEAVVRVLNQYLGTTVGAHEKGIKELLNSVRPILAQQLHNVDEARKMLR